MKRRNFLQWILGALGVGTVGVPAVKAKYVILSSPPSTQRKIKWSTIGDAESWDSFKAAHTCRFKGYEIIAFANKVCWHRVNDTDITAIDIEQMKRHQNGIDLDTFDVCDKLRLSNYTIKSWTECVIWEGSRERWHIIYVGGEQVFKFVFIGTN